MGREPSVEALVRAAAARSLPARLGSDSGELIDRIEKLRTLLPAFAQEMAAARREAARLRSQNTKLQRRVLELESGLGIDRRRPSIRARSSTPQHQKGAPRMSVRLQKILYTAEASVEGGREGHGRTTDGRLDVELSVPEAMGGDGGDGTNPEQLFAVGYAACFQSALLGVARGRKLDVSDSRIASTVGIGPTGDGGFTLQVSLDLHAPRISWRACLS